MSEGKVVLNLRGSLGRTILRLWCGSVRVLFRLAVEMKCIVEDDIYIFFLCE